MWVRSEIKYILLKYILLKYIVLKYIILKYKLLKYIICTNVVELANLFSVEFQEDLWDFAIEVYPY